MLSKEDLIVFSSFRHRQQALENCLTALNEGLFFISMFCFYIETLELATLYKQCSGDREIEEYIRRIHALRQRLTEANIHVKIIEVKLTRIKSIDLLVVFLFLGSCCQNGTINSKNTNIIITNIEQKNVD